MSTFLRGHGPILRWGLALLLCTSVAAATALGIGSITAHPAAAASASARGPSAVADAFNNQYVFWKGTDSHLWEAYYNSYTGAWNGPIGLGMGDLGSEPSATVTTQVFAGPGGKSFNGVYVYWRGTNDVIWMAYWNGSWHGPIAVTQTGGPVLVCSQPTATFVAAPAGPRIYIFWKGVGVSGTCGSDAESTHLWYAYSLTWPAYSGTDYFGPNYDSGSGALGSSPSAATVTAGLCASLMDAPCQRYVVIAWQGTNGYLWEELFDLVTGKIYGPVSDSAALGLGSPPSIAAPPSSSGITGEWDAFWQGSDSNHRLWFAPQFESLDESGGLNVDISPQQLILSGTLGSAPTVAEAFVGFHTFGNTNEYVFWKGTNGKLWEAAYDVSTGNWSLIALGAYSGTLG